MTQLDDSEREAAVADLFTPRARRQRWLDVEAALAGAEADAGVVPAEAAQAIAAHADFDLIDEDALTAAEAAAGHVMVPLVAALAELAGPEHGGWVHWGATTQNIQQTGDTIGIRDAHRVLVGRLERVLRVLADLAERHADTVMAGRTHGQHAVPITFGFKAAVWADIMARNLQRMREVEPRLFVSMTGGAAGTFATFGDVGPQIQRGVADRVGLVPMPLPSRAVIDHFAEWVSALGLIAASAQSIAEEVVRLMSAEFGEVEEALPATDVGSSTMPQKRNAKTSMGIITAAAQARALVPLALEATIQAHEVDGARSAMMDRAVEQSAVLVDGILEGLERVLSGLIVHPSRMRENLTLTRGLISAEAVMMRLAERIGRQQAHAVVHTAAVRSATSGELFADVLAADPAVADRLTAEEIRVLLDPREHVGLSARLARETADRVRAAADRVDGGAGAAKVSPP
ncbi:class-II fumarase/aspartase family protein [Microbacterium sp.]|uniref:class-II fumarase/aspartase family protein n=1 Tax=Microbacterium sp. TaxID=51671 RepID=UPI003C780A77